MGCFCSKNISTYELLVNDSFALLKIRQTEMSDVITELNLLTKDKYLSETNFQSFCNKYLIPVGIYRF